MIHAEIAGIEAGKMKVAEYWKLVEAKAVELCDLLNSLLKLTRGKTWSSSKRS